jgi:membrane protease YdiL (CAAX protease family)
MGPHSLPGRTFRWSAVLFAMSFPSLMAWFYFVKLSSPSGARAAGYAALTAYALGKAVQFAFPVAWVGAFERWRLRPARPRFQGLVFGLGFGVAVGLLILLVYYGALRQSRLLVGTPERILAKVATYHVDTPGRYLLMAFFLAGIHSLLEEYYWRWFVFGTLRELLAVPSAIVLSSLAFMAHHVIVLAVFFPGRFWTAALPFALGVAVGGGVWAWLYQWTGTIYAAWLSHLLIDAAILAIGYDMLFTR